VALLLVRAVFGISLILEGGFYFKEPSATSVVWFVGLAALAGGGLLLIGFLTPIVGAAVGACALSVALSLFPSSTPTLFDSKPAAVFALTMLVTLIGLGPGAFSVDARVFGRREIIIPPRTSQPRPTAL
jgi:uncharacterized membrane protein YphA (DoxX/SURF4 family)